MKCIHLWMGIVVTIKWKWFKKIKRNHQLSINGGHMLQCYAIWMCNAPATFQKVVT